MARPAAAGAEGVPATPSVEALGRGWYRETYFGHATDERLLGEKSTSYIEVPEAAERALRVLGADTLVAGHAPRPGRPGRVELAVQHRQRPGDSAPWRRRCARTSRRRPPGTPPRTSVSPFAYLERGRYAEHLDALVRGVPGDDARACSCRTCSTDEASRTLYGDLGVDPDFRPADPATRSTRAGSRSRAARRTCVDDCGTYFDASNLALSRRLGRPLPWWPRRATTRSDRD